MHCVSYHRYEKTCRIVVVLLLRGTELNRRRSWFEKCVWSKETGLVVRR
jgi:hypothetical protein